MPNVVIPALESIIDQPCPILNGAGHVTLRGYYGSDATILQAARVSYGAGTKTVREDASLIHYLLRNAHSSPFEQCNLTFHIKQPIFCERQLGRHRTARRNEISGRYSVMQEEFYTPTADNIRAQSTRNKQVGEGHVSAEDEVFALQCLTDNDKRAYEAYTQLLYRGVAREQARMVLPQNLMTEGYWQFDYSNLMKMLALRLDSHAQSEIREVAEPMNALFKLAAPLTHAAFEEHVLHARRFSASEVRVLRGWAHRIDREFGAGRATSDGTRELAEDKYVAEFMAKLGFTADNPPDSY